MYHCNQCEKSFQIIPFCYTLVLCLKFSTIQGIGHSLLTSIASCNSVHVGRSYQAGTSTIAISLKRAFKWLTVVLYISFPPKSRKKRSILVGAF